MIEASTCRQRQQLQVAGNLIYQPTTYGIYLNSDNS